MTHQFWKLPDPVLGRALGVPNQTRKPEPAFTAPGFWPSRPRERPGPLDSVRRKAMLACALAGSCALGDVGSCQHLKGRRLPEVSPGSSRGKAAIDVSVLPGPWAQTRRACVGWQSRQVGTLYFHSALLQTPPKNNVYEFLQKRREGGGRSVSVSEQLYARGRGSVHLGRSLFPNTWVLRFSPAPSPRKPSVFGEQNPKLRSRP